MTGLRWLAAEAGVPLLAVAVATLAALAPRCSSPQRRGDLLAQP